MFYDQIDGAAMGSTFGPVLANGLLWNFGDKYISRKWNNFV